MTNKPEHVSVAKFIADRMSALGKTARAIADEIGGPSDKAISMITNGMSKLPISLVSALAHSLDVDAAHLLRLTLREYMPDVLEAIEKVSQRRLISDREVALLDGFRAITGDRDVQSVVVERDGLLEVIVLGPSKL
jgi:transcriptional regulator with XRE-family HTH domain